MPKSLEVDVYGVDYARPDLSRPLRWRLSLDEAARQQVMEPEALRAALAGSGVHRGPNLHGFARVIVPTRHEFPGWH